MKPRKQRRYLLQQGDGLRDQGDKFGLNLEGKNVTQASRCPLAETSKLLHLETCHHSF